MATRKQGRDNRAKKSANGIEHEPVDDGSSLMAVPLDDDALKLRGSELVDWLVKQKNLKEKKGAQVKKINEELKLASQRIDVLAREIDTGEAFIERQTDLPFAGTGRRPGAAAERAAELANDNAAMEA
jgi:hypothetical protein